MPRIDEVAPNLFRISLHEPSLDLQFNYFLSRDEEPLLFCTGYRATFPVLRDAVARVLDPATIRWVGFSHFESDECGALNDWLQAAPEAQAITGFIGAAINLNDFALRPPRVLADGETLPTGRRRFRFCSTAHLPHGWDACVLFEETEKTLLCSDLFFHQGNPAPLVETDIVGPAAEALRQNELGPLAGSVPYTPQTDRILGRLAELQPQTLAVMHGSSYRGDGASALRGLTTALRETLGPEAR